MNSYKPFARALLLCSSLLAGCAANVGDSITIPVGELALHDAVPKEKSIAKLEDHVKDAQSDNMPFLAPHYFREASDILKTVQQSSPRDVSTYELAKADAILDKGEAVSAIVKRAFAAELELKDLLDKYEANEIYPWEYKLAVHKLSRLIEKVELNGTANIEQDKENLSKSMRELYNKTIQYVSSRERHIIYKDAEIKDAEK